MAVFGRLKRKKRQWIRDYPERLRQGDAVTICIESLLFLSGPDCLHAAEEAVATVLHPKVASHHVVKISTVALCMSLMLLLSEPTVKVDCLHCR
jgi:hypothetical protein